MPAKKKSSTMLPKLTFVNFNAGPSIWQRIKGICFAIGYPLFFWTLYLLVMPISYILYNPLYKFLSGWGISKKPAIEMTKQFVYTLKLLITNGELMRGDKVPELAVFTIDGEKKLLSSMIDPNKLTILNFGSCTCPVYMGRSVLFYEMTTRYKNNKYIDFFNCYVPEAHPVDEWKIESNKRELIQQQTMEERLIALKYLVEDIEERVNESSTTKWTPDHIHWIADSLNAPNLDYYFNARPIRMCIVRNNRIVYKGGYGPWFYDVDEIEDCIKTFISDHE